MADWEPAGASADSAALDFDPADIEGNKIVAGLAYLLFFLPLIACPDSRYGRFHANQGLLLLILSVGGGIVLFVLSTLLTLLSPFVGLSLSTLLYTLFYILILALAIIGLLAGINGKAKELPVIGKFRLLR